MNDSEQKIELIQWIANLENTEILDKLTTLKRGYEEQEKIAAGDTSEPLYAKGKAWEFFTKWEDNN